MTGRVRRNLSRVLPDAVVMVAALLATLPLLLDGPSCGHDLTFHLLNWIDAAHQWRLGTVHPWWCAAAAWNAGEARFVFYPPLSWVLGALLTIVVGAARAPVVYTFLALTACGITMQRFLRHYVAAPLALLGACLYLAHPYLLFTATERTAYGELLAAAWLPWLLQESLRDRIAARRLALPVALLWFTNTPSAVLGTYTLAAVVAIRWVLAKRQHPPAATTLLRPAILGYTWGVALAALYLLPAIVQHNAVEVAEAFGTGMRPEDGTLFSHTGEPLHDHVVHQASVLAMILLTVASAAALIHFARHHRAQRLHGMRDLVRQRALAAPSTTLASVLVTLTAGIAFLLTPASLFLWHHLPELHFLQFPWRMLMLQGVITTTLVVLSIRTPLRTRWAVAIALCAVTALSVAAHRSYAQACDSEDAPRSVLAQYDRGAGFEPYDEYTPKDVDNDLLHPNEPLAWTASDRNAPPPPTSTLANNLRVDTSVPANPVLWVQPGPADRFLILRQHRFPNRHFLIDNRELTEQDTRDDGLVVLPLRNSSPHVVYFLYTESLDQQAGLGISVLAAVVLGIVLLAARRPSAVTP